MRQCRLCKLLYEGYHNCISDKTLSSKVSSKMVDNTFQPPDNTFRNDPCSKMTIAETVTELQSTKSISDHKI